MEDYDGELLSMAHELASRLMPAFDGSRTGWEFFSFKFSNTTFYNLIYIYFFSFSGIPYTRVNLRLGILPDTINETCTAGAGSLLLEFGGYFISKKYDF